MDFPGFPAFPKEKPYSYEPPRTMPGRVFDRKARLEALGDGVVWQCVYPIAVTLKEAFATEDAQRAERLA